MVFCVKEFGCCECLIFSYCDLESANSISVPCNTSVAILTLLEAFLQQLSFSILCLQEVEGYTVDFVFADAVVEVSFLSRSIFNTASFSLQSYILLFKVLVTPVATATRCVAKARLKASEPLCS